jgi:4-amino-4-deoxy-L-arabinose transferase-like glycosyltransferase
MIRLEGFMKKSITRSPKTATLIEKIRIVLMKPLTRKILITMAGLIVSLVFFGITGIHHGGDTKRYLAGATNLLGHLPLTGKQPSYLGYLLVVAFVQSLNLGTNYIILIQIIVASLAGLTLYEIGREFGGETVGILGALLYIFNLEIVRWHTYLLTDSLYISFVIFSTWFIHLAAKRGKWFYVPALLSIAFTILIRPNGWLFLWIAPIYWLSQTTLSKWKKWVFTLVVLGCIGAAGIMASGFSTGVEAEQPDQMLKQGVIIWGYKDWQFPMPIDELTTSKGLVSGLQYGIKHPISSIGLAFSRVAIEIIHIRPFYSLVHNTIVLLLMLPIYIFSISGWYRTRGKPITKLLTIVILSHLALVALFFADWDGRFILYIFPLICVLASFSLVNLVKAHIPVRANSYK